MSDAPAETPRAPTVYFIDDSATMREVIKIAFDREKFHVVTCHDAETALKQIEQLRPDVVISDVIMPEKNGYEVCQHIKQHAELAATPVILMSGVVNRTVAEKAMAVKADDLVRKPFQPQELIARVRHLLNPKPPAPPGDAPSTGAAQALSSLFTPAAAPAAVAPAAATHPATAALRPAAPAWSSAPAAVAGPRATAVATAAPPASSRAAAPGSPDHTKLRIEILRLEQLVKKLQAELEAERQYCHALEAHIKTLQEAD